MSMTPEEVSKYVFSADKELRLLSLDYIVSNLEAFGNNQTLRALQACFIAGYKEAQERAHHALEEAEARTQELQDQLADVSKVMNSPENPDDCDHIVDTSKMVDVNSCSCKGILNNWISVKDRLPRALELVLYFHELHGPSIGYYDPACPKPGYQWISEECGDNKTDRITHWMPLPSSPEEER
jgi:hypothetical protein